MIIKNKKYKNFTNDDLFVCVLGYEPRSRFLLNKNIDTRNSKNTLVFNLNKEKIPYGIKEKEIELVNCGYNDTTIIKEQIHNFSQNNLQCNDKTTLNIDYSSMPRSWYCALPIFISKTIDDNNELVFWYTAGDYPSSYIHYPSAGIDSISVFSGLSLPASDIMRCHILGLGYDSIRTETVKSIVEPDMLISCYAYNPADIKTKENVCKANKGLIESSRLTVALPIDNFSGMVDKLCGLVYDQIQSGQIIIIPDGPKPLIMAMSLIPDLVKKDGVTCLHISRNTHHHSEIPVEPRGNEIFGFQVL